VAFIGSWTISCEVMLAQEAPLLLRRESTAQAADHFEWRRGTDWKFVAIGRGLSKRELIFEVSEQIE